MYKYGSLLVLTVVLTGCGNGTDDSVPQFDEAISSSQQSDAHFVFSIEGSVSSAVSTDQTSKPMSVNPERVPSDQDPVVLIQVSRPLRPEHEELPELPNQSVQLEQFEQVRSESPVLPETDATERVSGPEGTGNESFPTENVNLPITIDGDSFSEGVSIYSEFNTMRDDLATTINAVSERVVSFLAVINQKISQGEELDSIEMSCVAEFDGSLGNSLSTFECAVPMYPSRDDIVIRLGTLISTDECNRELRFEADSGCSLAVAIVGLANLERDAETLMAIYANRDRINVIPVTSSSSTAEFCSLKIDSGEVQRESKAGYCRDSIRAISAMILAQPPESENNASSPRGR